MIGKNITTVKNKFISCVLVAVLLVSVAVVPASAAYYTEYYEYSGSAISSTIASTLESYAFNIINDNSNDYKYWVGVRVGQYEYLLFIYSSLDDLFINSVIAFSTGQVYMYDEHLYSYTYGNSYRYQAGFSAVDNVDVAVSLTRSYIIGNVPGTIAVNAEHETVFDMQYVEYILYTLIIFLLLFVAFKFLNKRWLLP